MRSAQERLAEIRTEMAWHDTPPEVSETRYSSTELERLWMVVRDLLSEIDALAWEKNEMQRLVLGHDEYNRVNQMLTAENDDLRSKVDRLRVGIQKVAPIGERALVEQLLTETA